MNKKYQMVLKDLYPTKRNIAAEIVNLNAILSLPKPTEHFVSDLHGEYNAFQHVLRNGSGSIRKKIEFLFSNSCSQEELQELTILVYYPEEKMEKIKSILRDKQSYFNWYNKTLRQLIKLCIFSSKRYTRSKVRKAFPSDFAYIIEELLFRSDEYADKHQYYKKIFTTVLDLNQDVDLIITFCYLIQRFVVDHLHVLGDIFDRGPYPDRIVDTLINHHSVDIQWGNHDILWMGASRGVPVLIANVIRICARYNNLDILEDHYGINLLPLLNFAQINYQASSIFFPKEVKKQTDLEITQVTKIHHAISVLQFKLEGQIIQRCPEFKLDERDMLYNINFEKGTVQIGRKEYPLIDNQFPTIDKNKPTVLSREEADVLKQLIKSFINSEKLQRHTNFLFDKGNMYKKYNDNLLIHGCIPLANDKNFLPFEYDGKDYKGKALLDFFDNYIRSLSKESSTPNKGDLAWYLWTGEVSPLFGKKRMTTFERYYVEDKETHKENKNCYYHLRNNENVCRMILQEFGLDPKNGRIINGHTPIKEKDGENPIKANGKMLVIDGGFSKAYQKKTGVAGYTLLYNSYGMELAAHEPFLSKKDAINKGIDIVTKKRIINKEVKRITVGETTVGKQLKQQLKDLTELYNIY